MDAAHPMTDWVILMFYQSKEKDLLNQKREKKTEKIFIYFFLFLLKLSPSRFVCCSIAHSLWHSILRNIFSLDFLRLIEYMLLLPSTIYHIISNICVGVTWALCSSFFCTSHACARARKEKCVEVMRIFK